MEMCSGKLPFVILSRCLLVLILSSLETKLHAIRELEISLAGAETILNLSSHFAKPSILRPRPLFRLPMSYRGRYNVMTTNQEWAIRR